MCRPTTASSSPAVPQVGYCRRGQSGRPPASQRVCIAPRVAAVRFMPRPDLLQQRVGEAVRRGGHADVERRSHGRVRSSCVSLEQEVGTRELPGGDLALLGQSKELHPLLRGECHEISLGPQSLPFLRENTTGRTRYQNRCGGPLVRRNFSASITRSTAASNRFLLRLAFRKSAITLRPIRSARTGCFAFHPVNT